MEVRKAGPADSAVLAEVAAATFPMACPAHTTQDAITSFISKNLTVTNFDSYIGDPTRILFLAMEQDAALGYAMLILTEPTDPDVSPSITRHPTSELNKLYVRGGHHGLGVSTALVDAVVGAAAAAGRVGIWLGVNQENARANAFYEKSGFVRVGFKKFLVGDAYEDDFVRERLI